MKSKIIPSALLLFTLLMFIKPSIGQVCTFSFSLGNDTTICPGTTISFNLVAPSGASPYLWDNGTTAATRHISNFGTYYCKGSQIGTDVVSNGDFSAGNSGFTSDYLVGTG
ncbi:MAG: hypothetical protein ABUL44_00635, partial [Flavobacterium sp.]